jgi:hypothetical protein
VDETSGSLTRASYAASGGEYDPKRFTQLIDIAGASISHDDKLEQSRDASYTSSFGLGGYPAECINIDCRLKKVEQLARFSALYADRVIIRM